MLTLFCAALGLCCVVTLTGIFFQEGVVAADLRQARIAEQEARIVKEIKKERGN